MLVSRKHRYETYFTDFRYYSRAFCYALCFLACAENSGESYLGLIVKSGITNEAIHPGFLTKICHDTNVPCFQIDDALQKNCKCPPATVAGNASTSPNVVNITQNKNYGKVELPNFVNPDPISQANLMFKNKTQVILVDYGKTLSRQKFSNSELLNNTFLQSQVNQLKLNEIAAKYETDTL